MIPLKISIEIAKEEIEKYKIHGMAHILLEGCIPGTEYEIKTQKFGEGRVFPLNHVWISERREKSMKIILANIHVIPKKNAISVDHNKKLENILITFPIHKNHDIKSIIKLGYKQEQHVSEAVMDYMLNL